MIILQDIGDQLAWTCDCEDHDGIEETHQVQTYSIVTLWSDVLDHVSKRHRRVGLDLYLGQNVVGLTKAFFGAVNVFPLTFTSPFIADSDGVLTDPR